MERIASFTVNHDTIEAGDAVIIVTKGLPLQDLVDVVER